MKVYLKKLLSDSYIRAFKKITGYENISKLEIDSWLKHWFNPNVEKSEDEHYVGIEYNVKFGHWIREDFKKHLMKKGVTMKNCSYAWVLKERIIPTDSNYFRI